MAPIPPKIRYITLAIIIFAELAGTSLWFFGNAAIAQIPESALFETNQWYSMATIVPVGFMLGAIVFSVLMLSDRYQSSLVFMVSCILGGIANLGLVVDWEMNWPYHASRLLAGFFLAGIYPVGIKIVTDWFDQKLPKMIGILMGFLVIGLSIPHLIKDMTPEYSGKLFLTGISISAIVGGILLYWCLPEAPFARLRSRYHYSEVKMLFKNHNFRSATVGYVGHFWELIAFWSFLPILLATWSSFHAGANLNFNICCFGVFGLGGVATIGSGMVSQYLGSERIAMFTLALSGFCCLLSPLMFLMPIYIFLPFLGFWGMMIIADSPQLIAILAKLAPQNLRGTALTVVISIGLLITIISIRSATFTSVWLGENFRYLPLAIGPLTGTFFLYRLARKRLSIFRM